MFCIIIETSLQATSKSSAMNKLYLKLGKIGILNTPTKIWLLIYIILR